MFTSISAIKLFCVWFNFVKPKQNKTKSKSKQKTNTKKSHTKQTKKKTIKPNQTKTTRNRNHGSTLRNLIKYLKKNQRKTKTKQSHKAQKIKPKTKQKSWVYSCKLSNILRKKADTISSWFFTLETKGEEKCTELWDTAFCPERSQYILHILSNLVYRIVIFLPFSSPDWYIFGLTR